MSTIRIRHVDRFVDRHGKARFYYRPPGGKRTPLPGAFASAEFLAGYQKALAGDTPEKRRNAQAATGTIGHLIADYFASPEFLRMSKGTQRAYRHVIDRWVRDDNVGHRPVANMKREHVKAMIARRAATPGAANDLLKKIRLLMNFAIDANLRMDNPATRIKRFKGGAHHTWTEEEIGRFERRWPVGSKERIAFAFLLYTGQRRSDVVRMSWRDVEDDVIRVVQQKTGAKVWIPIHPTLAGIFNVAPRGHIAMLTTEIGKPFSPAGFGNWMADRIDAAELPKECVTHGLRKAAARRLAEAGCSASEIAAITGHKTLAEVERYVKEANQKHLPGRPCAARPVRNRTKLPNRKGQFGKSGKKMSRINGSAGVAFHTDMRTLAMTMGVCAKIVGAGGQRQPETTKRARWDTSRESARQRVVAASCPTRRDANPRASMMRPVITSFRCRSDTPSHSGNAASFPLSSASRTTMARWWRPMLTPKALGRSARTSSICSGATR